jgi:hypothetical protein
MMKLSLKLTDFHLQNVPEIWKHGSKVRYDDRIFPWTFIQKNALDLVIIPINT